MKATVDSRLLEDLWRFADIEAAIGDVEPWAAVLRDMLDRHVMDHEEAAWAVKLYNAFDDFSSAFMLMGAWPDPRTWLKGHRACKLESAKLPCGSERRNLRASKVPGELMMRHLDSYATALAGQTQMRWLREGIPPLTVAAAGKGVSFDGLMSYLRRSVWGTGRQAAFEWAEFAGKVLGLPVSAGHGCLWESSGPRDSLERIFNGGERAASQAQLDQWACYARDYLAERGTPLEWWDFETVICDFGVMRKGRYYPGKHIAMMQEEITKLDQSGSGWGFHVRQSLDRVTWPEFAADRRGVDKRLNSHYRRTGEIRTPFGRVK